MGDFDALYLGLDPDERKRGFQFEHLCKWYLENDPTYTSDLVSVWLWKQWPGRWRDAEAGIDLVAEDVEGKLWAIQAKAYSEHRAIPKREIDKFLSESNRAEFSYRLLISTSSRGFHHIARDTVQAQDKPVYLVDINDLRSSPAPWPDTFDDLRPAQRWQRAVPRDYQRDPILDVVAGLSHTDRGQLVMACGTGKTLTAWFIAAEVAAQRTLVLVPSLSLLKQTMREWQRATGGEGLFASLPVCSDDTVRSDDAAVAYTAEIGARVTTDPAVIADFLRKGGSRVVFCTYQSSAQVARAMSLEHVPSFDLVVADEAHRIAGPVSSDFAIVLDETKIRADKRLFMTATPRVYSAAVKRSSKEENFEYASMDDHEKFGEVFHHLSFGEAIRRNLLTDYRVAVIGVDSDTYREMAQRGAYVTTDGKEVVDCKSLASQIGLAKAMRRFNLHRVISFHSGIYRVRKFADSLPRVIEWMPADQRPDGELWSAHASGEMDAGLRSRLLSQLSDLHGADRGLLSNARCLSEGVDVPTLDGVAFIDPKNSEVDIIQAVGRAIRRSDSKTVGTIVIPVFVDNAEDTETALESSEFKPVWNVLRALRSHDEELAGELDELRRELGRQGGTPRIPHKIHIELPARVSQEFAAAFDIRLVEQTSSPWEFWFGLLETYVARTGDARVPASHQERGCKLGSWVVSQRHDRVKGLLSCEREARLAALPGWVWNSYDALWEEGFQALLRYVEVNGDARVPHDCTLDGFRLGQWVVARRHQYAKGNLPESLAHELSELPGWIWNTFEAAWQDGYTALKRYVDIHGTVRLPQRATVDGVNLKSWITTQRTRYRSGKVDPDKVALLEQIPGWTWDPFTDDWDQGFAHLQAYVDDNGDALVGISYKAGDFKLGKWVARQRVFFKTGRLHVDRVSRLESLPGWVWDKRDAQWQAGLRCLRDYVAAGGSACPRYTTKVDGYPLGNWVIQQRFDHRKGELSQSRVDLLNAIPGWSWDPEEDAWTNGFARLQKYVAQCGHAAVPTAFVEEDGFRLGRWVHSRRTKHLSGESDFDRDRQLEELPGWLWRPKSDAWEAGYARLKSYLSVHGHSNIPSDCVHDGYKLGAWVETQRSKKRAGTLKTERERRLEELPGWLWERSREDPFEVGVSHLRRYVQTHGDAVVPFDCVVDGYPLGQWVGNQRQKRARGALALDRQAQLDSLPGWAWHTRDAAWEAAFSQVKKFLDEHGHARVPISYVTADGFHLGRWVNGQRSAFSRKTMRVDRQRRLERLPGWCWRAR